MRDKAVAYLLLGPFLVLALGCAIPLKREGPLFSDAPGVHKIPMASYELVVEDGRGYVDDRKLKVPLVYVATSTSSYMDRVSPKIDFDMEGIFKEVLEEAQAPGDRDLMFVAEIQDAVQDFTGDEFTCTEYVSFRVKVDMKDACTGETMKSSEGEAWGSRKTTHASLKSVERMFHDTVRLAFIDALNGL